MDWSGLPDPGTQAPAIDFSGLPDKATDSPVNASGTPDLASFGAQAAQYAPDGLTPENEGQLARDLTGPMEEALMAQARPFIQHPFKSAYDMVVPNAQDFQSIAALTKPETYQQTTQPGSQEWLNQVVGYALPLLTIGAGDLLKGAHPEVLPEAPIEKPPVQPEVPPVEAAPSESLKSETAAVDLSKLPDQEEASTGEATPQSTASVPVMMTKQMEADLRTAGFSQSDINKMTPQEAWANLQPEQPSVTIPAEDAKYAGTSPELQARNAQAGQSDAAPVQPASVGSSDASRTGAPERPGSGTSNRAFAETYGDEQVPGGQGVDTTQLLDNARADIRSGAVNPYSILSRTRAKGIANTEEYATLAAEHERLVNDAVAKQKANAPDAPQAAKAAEDFAHAIQPHKTAASDLMRLFQGDVNYDMSTPFGMDQYMKSEIGRTPTIAERPKFNRMSNDIGRAQTEVQQAVARSDARVQGRYAKVRDIPMEEAASRVREWLKDCIV